MKRLLLAVFNDVNWVAGRLSVDLEYGWVFSLLALIFFFIFGGSGNDDVPTLSSDEHEDIVFRILFLLAFSSTSEVKSLVTSAVRALERAFE